MAKRVSKPLKHLDYQKVAEIFSYREKSLKLFFSDYNPQLKRIFVGYSRVELEKELNGQLIEIERDACLNLLACIEAAFRLDYATRCIEKDRAILSRRFRKLYSEYQHRIPLEDILFEEWKKILKVQDVALISALKGAFKYRHWLAHGRYWELKTGRKDEYDFYELYNLAIQIESFGLKKM